MRSRTHRWIPWSVPASIAVATLALASVVLQARPDPTPAAAPEALTVYVDIGPLSRKKSGAEKLTEQHREAARDGWQLIDVEPYVENGDLQGFFVSYTR